MVETEMGRHVSRRFRSAALRSDQHILRGRDGAECESQAQIQPGSVTGLSAIGDCPGGHTGWISLGL
jgi:hypothetical protein